MGGGSGGRERREERGERRKKERGMKREKEGGERGARRMEWDRGERTE